MKKSYAIFMMAAAFAACSREELPQVIEEPETYTMTIEATKGDEPTTRALSLVGKTISAIWDEGEIVEVYQSGTKIGELTAAASTGASTTLSGSFESAPSASADLTFYFHSATPCYSGQDGTLETIASTFDFCAPATITTDNFEVDDVNRKISVPGGISFGANQQAIVKFTLMDKEDDDAAISAISLTVNAGTNTYVVTPDSATDELFVAIPAISSKTVSLIATDGDKFYFYKKTGVTFSNSQYYSVGVKMVESDLYRPLTFEAKTAEATVSFSPSGSNETVQYSTDGGKTWTDYSNAITLDNVGDKVLFRGNNNGYYHIASSPKSSRFTCTEDCYIYGNIMSLINSTGYPTATSLVNRCFEELFKGNSHLKSHATKELILPATVIGGESYCGMFNGCTGLTTPPVILATTLSGSKSLGKMFAGCTGLTSLPELLVTQLGNYCYQEMFKDCTSLTSVPSNYLPCTGLEEGCYEGMFQGCTNLASAPTLPAGYLKKKCYGYMFDGCSQLNSITCLATSFETVEGANAPTYQWLNGVASTGTFTTPSSTTWAVDDASGIPSGWTRVNSDN